MTRNVLFALTMKSVAKALGEYCTEEISKGLLSLQLEDVVLDLEKPTTCGVPWQNLKVIRSHVFIVMAFWLTPHCKKCTWIMAVLIVIIH